MATLSAGYSFGATETVTNAKLASLVNNGSVGIIAQTDISASNGLVFVGTSAPSDTDQIWVDTNSTPVLLRHYNSTLSAWVPSNELAIMTNKSTQTGAVGRVLILDTSNSNSYTYTSTAGDTKFVGIETGSIAANASAPVVSRGLGVTVLLEHSASAGTFIRTSTATGKAEPCVSTSSGVFGFLTEAGTASARSNVFGLSVNSTVDQAANYTWTGTHTFNGNITLNSASGNQTGWTPIVQRVSQLLQTSATATTTVGAIAGAFTSASGTQFLSASITPQNAANKLIVEVLLMVSNSAAGARMYGGLFRDSGDAIATTGIVQNQSGNVGLAPMVLRYEASAGSTSATTFKFRAGPESASTISVNCVAGSSLYSETIASSMVVTEMKA